MKNKACLVPDEPVVIHPSLKSYFSYTFVKTAFRLRVALNEALETHGLIAPQMGLLRVLETGGPISQIELGRALGIDKATMVKFIDRLSELKYVNREEGSTDRRVKLVSLSKEGAKKLATLSKIYQKVEADFLSPLTAAEQKTMRGLLLKLLV